MGPEKLVGPGILADYKLLVGVVLFSCYYKFLYIFLKKIFINKEEFNLY